MTDMRQMTIQDIPQESTRRKTTVRIREFRKLRGLTLLQLAEKIGTTPQTVQRLETDNMTVSLHWLDKISAALTVDPADLISERGDTPIPMIGRLGSSGRVSAAEDQIGANYRLEVPASAPVAVRVDIGTGPYEAGSVLIASRFRPEDIENAHGTDCIAEIEGGKLMLRRLMRVAPGRWTLIPLEAGGEILSHVPLAWAARVIMAIRYY